MTCVGRSTPRVSHFIIRIDHYQIALLLTTARTCNTYYECLTVDSYVFKTDMFSEAGDPIAMLTFCNVFVLLATTPAKMLKTKCWEVQKLYARQE